MPERERTKRKNRLHLGSIRWNCIPRFSESPYDWRKKTPL